MTSKIICRTLLISCLAYPAFSANTPQEIKIESEYLVLMDGVIDIGPMVKIIAHFGQLNRRDKSPLRYKGAQRTVKELVEIEHALSKNTQVGAQQKKVEEALLKEVFENALSQVHTITLPFKGIVQDKKRELEDVVAHWCAARNRKNSILVKWFEMDEQQFMRRYLQSFKSLSVFLNEFTILLMDVQSSLPESTKNFEEGVKKARQAQEAALKKAQAEAR